MILIQLILITLIMAFQTSSFEILCDYFETKFAVHTFPGDLN